MKVIKTLEDIKELQTNGNCVTMGNFDGVHAGHRGVIRRVIEKALETGSKSVLITFFPHPLKILAPERAPRLLQTLDDRLDSLSETGLDAVFVIDFTMEFSRLSPEEFIRDYLVHSLNTRELFVGGDVLFGRNRSGNIETLRENGRKYGFAVNIVEPVIIDGVRVGSSLIRKLIARGEMESVSRYLGRDFSICGTVVRGDRVGRKIGFPTANIATKTECLPADGVYAGKLLLGEEMLPCAAHIGARPTFGKTEKTIEAHILDFHGDIYDREIRLFFMKRIREAEAFSDEAELKKVIESDIRKVRELLE